jgi:nucleoside-diphosphate-sugar epimerase
MNISVIGGSGFIGTRLTTRLLENGYSVKILDKAKSLTYPDLWIKGDVRDMSSLLSALEGCDVIYNLAAEHRDDVSPRSLYWDVNVRGAGNVCSAAEELGINKIIFTSSVAVYGFTNGETDETGELRPFNDYGRTKLEAEKVYQKWQKRDENRALTIIRPTVVFGEGNRGNVYNLLQQIAKDRFIMVGKGDNIKSMTYVENVVSFLVYALNISKGCHIYNFVDKPDLDMNTLVTLVKKELGKDGKIGLRIPYSIGYLGGLIFDIIARITNRKFPISAIRIKKFCSNTQFASSTIKDTSFNPPFTLAEGLERTIRHEFLSKKSNTDILFYTE